MSKLRSINHKTPLKTVGRQTARLLTALYDRSQTSFTLRDVEEITGLASGLASSLVHKAVKRGLVSRIKRGLFMIIPAELGSSVEYFGDPYLVAQRLADTTPCFISHGSAMEIHRMVTQPQLAVFASSTRRIRSRTLQGMEFHFVLIKREHFFGTTKHWITKQESVDISDLERTIIDGLRQPEYCGGVSEVAKGLWMRHQDIQSAKLIEYAIRINVGAVTRRLGYLLELYELSSERDLAKLQRRLTTTYVPLDPMLPRVGHHLKRWQLLVNITPRELEAIRAS